ncbi:hypothetical protein EFY87_14235 [Flexivirga caeni]|uniref:Uncharacterized protein n=1 Tax=Flexivirga caeni TaxID=2294115 RepID=A0A3M9M770_9MICO|nr:hypothetical protein EFY87_14235 [Flexivirga caeni]
MVTDYRNINAPTLTNDELIDNEPRSVVTSNCVMDNRPDLILGHRDHEDDASRRALGAMH